MTPRQLIAASLFTVAGSVTAPACLSLASAAVPNCGGQSAAPQPVPYVCNLPGIDITYQGVTRHFAAQVFADGTKVTVTFTMSAPLPVAVPIRIVHHEGISGAGGSENESSGVIPAGATTAVLVDSAPCRNGQLDVKAVNTSNGSGDKYRVGGPWIRNGTGCIDTSTVPQSTTVPSTTIAPPSTSTPGSTTTPPGPVESTAPTTVGGGASSKNLPATGSSVASLFWVGVMALFVGGVLFFTRRRPA